MKLIVGLGNPGAQYENTRHNTGFLVIDRLIEDDKNSMVQGKGPFQINKLPFQNGKVIVAKPTVFMNESGKAIQALVDYFKLKPQDCLIVADDVNLPIGTSRLRLKGSAGGHHGLESAIQFLGTQNFPRLRMGVGTGDLSGQNLTDFVLGRFSREEMEKLASEIKEACHTCLEWAA